MRKELARDYRAAAAFVFIGLFAFLSAAPSWAAIPDALIVSERNTFSVDYTLPLGLTLSYDRSVSDNHTYGGYLSAAGVSVGHAGAGWLIGGIRSNSTLWSNPKSGTYVSFIGEILAITWTTSNSPSSSTNMGPTYLFPAVGLGLHQEVLGGLSLKLNLVFPSLNSSGLEVALRSDHAELFAALGLTPLGVRFFW